MSGASAGDIFEVDHVVSLEHNGPAVKLTVYMPDSDTHEHVELVMPPESALWLALELWKASGLDLNHNVRFRRRAVPGPAGEKP